MFAIADEGTSMSTPDPRPRLIYSPVPAQTSFPVDEQVALSSLTKDRKPGLFETLRSEMRMRNYSHKTIKAYASCIRSLTNHFSPRHPRELTNEDLRSYLIHLIEREQYQASTINQVINAARFEHKVSTPHSIIEDEVRRCVVFGNVNCNCPFDWK